MRLAIPFLVLLGSAACESKPPAPKAPTCELNLESLEGKTFVMLEVQGDKSEKPNPQARFKYVKEDGKLVAKYTVKSLGNVYDYTCEKNSDLEYRCTTKPDVERICMALEAHKEGTCSAEAIDKLGFKAGDDFDKTKKTVDETIAKYKEAGQWDRAKAMNNNLANPIQGVLFTKIDEKRCRLTVDDMYYVVYNGKRKEDFNPVGTNAFVLDADNDYVFEDCPNGRMLADLTTPELPAKLSDIPPERSHEAGKDIYYFYVGDDEKKAADGCTYSMDTYANWKSVSSDVAVTPDDKGLLTWKATHQFGADDKIAVGGGRSGGVFHVVRHKECAGKKETIDTVCSVAALN